MLGEVGEVLDVERRERQPIGDAAGRDPCVVNWPGPASFGRGSRQFTPHRPDALAARDHRLIGQPVIQHGPVTGSPPPEPGPLGQFAHRYEGDQRLLASQARR